MRRLDVNRQWIGSTRKQGQAQRAGGVSWDAGMMLGYSFHYCLTALFERDKIISYTVRQI